MKKIYMIAGVARSGKDTTANYIKKIYEENGTKSLILQLAEPLKYYAKKVLNWNGSEDTKPREFLQAVGDIVRKDNQKFVIERLIEDTKVLLNFVDVIIISDVRFPLEFEEIGKNFPSVVNIFITRPSFNNSLTDKEKKHITETALNNYDNYDYVIENNAGLDELEQKVRNIIREEME